MALVNPRRFVQRVGILVVAGIALAGFVSGQAAGAAGERAQVAHYTVQQGDTLWAIAAELAPNSDPRDYVANLVELNQLTTANVTPGQDLVIPNN